MSRAGYGPRGSPLWAFVACAFSALAAAPVGVRAQAPRVETALDTTLVRVGDRLHLTVSVEHAAGQTVVWPDSLSLEPFEVLEVERLPPAGSGDRVVTAARFTLTIFELGDVEVPSFDLAVAEPDGRSTPVSTDAFGVSVRSVGLDESGDIRAIRGPLGIPLGLINLLLWLALLLVLAAIGFWLWRRWRRPAETETRRPVILPRRPHEEAYEALDRLEASDLLERGQIKEYHIRISEIIRTYVEGRFDVYALELSTGEVIAGLRDAGLAVETLRDFDGFLSDCDLVKFAKLRPSPDACRSMMVRARRLVDHTKPVVDASVSLAGEPGSEAERPTAPAPEGASDETHPEHARAEVR